MVFLSVEGLRIPMGERANRRPMPAEQSIHWKPLHDPHYVVASLQLGDGGRRQIFARPKVLTHAQRIGNTAHGRRLCGLVLGELYECPVTDHLYMVVESLTEQRQGIDDADLAAVMHELMARPPENKHQRVLGWYCTVSNVEQKPPPALAGIHVSYFAQPWQTMFLVTDGVHDAGGAFFLRDTVNARWFLAPFYEVLDQVPDASQPKPTCVPWWRQYMSADTVVLVGLDPEPPAERATGLRATLSGIVAPLRDALGEPTDRVAPLADRSIPFPPDADGGPQASPPVPLARSHEPPPAQAPTSAADADVQREAVDESLDDTVPLPVGGPHREQQRDNTPRDVPPVSRTPRRRSWGRMFDKQVDRHATKEGLRQRIAGRDSVRRVGDGEDTAVGDDPKRYIELALAEGFFVAAQFEAVPDSSQAETLWVLNEPYSGLLLTVVSTASEVLDASLHYNQHTDAEGLSRTPFTEHRDVETQTIYVRETCVDSLRARCQRLRESQSLVREWIVSPAIHLLTPAEWRSVTAAYDDPRGTAFAIRALNDRRTAELPEGIRAQFHLTLLEERSA